MFRSIDYCITNSKPILGCPKRSTLWGWGTVRGVGAYNIPQTIG